MCRQRESADRRVRTIAKLEARGEVERDRRIRRIRVDHRHARIHGPEIRNVYAARRDWVNFGNRRFRDQYAVPPETEDQITGSRRTPLACLQCGISNGKALMRPVRAVYRGTTVGNGEGRRGL